MSKTKPAAAEAAPDQAEALLLGLIQECHAVIRDALAPAVRAAVGHHESFAHVEAIALLVNAGTGMSDAITRLRRGGEEKVPELRQRITVERIQSGPSIPRLSPGEGGGV